MPREYTDEQRAEREAQVVRLRSAQLTWADVGAQLDPPVSGPRAFQLYQRALLRVPAMAVDEHRREGLAALDMVVRRLLRIVADPATEAAVQVSALKEIRATWAERFKLVGAYAPQRHALLSSDAVDAEIRALEGELARERARGSVDGELVDDGDLALEPEAVTLEPGRAALEPGSGAG